MKKLSEKELALHEEFSKYGKNAKKWMRKCVLMLPLIEKKRIWEKKGFGSIYEYAAKIAGMSRYKVTDSLRIIRKIADKPALMELARTKGLNAVRPVVTIATKKSAEFWAGKAGEMSKHTLETFAKDFKKEEKLRLSSQCNQLEFENYAVDGDENITANGISKIGPGTGSPLDNGTNKPKFFRKNGKVVASNVEFSSADNGLNKTRSLCKNGEGVVENEYGRVQLSMKVDPEVLEALKKMKGAGDWNEALKKLLRLQAEKPKPIRSKSRKAPAAVEKYIKKRSGGVCEHPNCCETGEQIHHIEPFALSKMHDVDKMLHLCEAHHQIIHLGYIDDGDIRVDGRAVILEFGVEMEADTTLNLGESRRKQWRQIEKLPSYDIKNLINGRILEYRRYEYAC